MTLRRFAVPILTAIAMLSCLSMFDCTSTPPPPPPPVTINGTYGTIANHDYYALSGGTQNLRIQISANTATALSMVSVQNGGAETLPVMLPYTFDYVAGSIAYIFPRYFDTDGTTPLYYTGSTCGIVPPGQLPQTVTWQFPPNPLVPPPPPPNSVNVNIIIITMNPGDSLNNIAPPMPNQLIVPRPMNQQMNTQQKVN